MATYRTLFSIRRLWIILIATMLVMFGTLLYFGGEIYQTKPPIPEIVSTGTGETILTRSDILRGQAVWRAMGGMQQGSIWGHGGYLAPDWSADWLHREALALLDIRSYQEQGVAFDDVADPRDQEWLRASLEIEMRTNTYNAESGAVVISPERVQAVRQVGQHFSALFQGEGPEALALREEYALPLHSSLSDDDAAALNAFFFWTSWAATTERPDRDFSYTSNWPHEPLVGNVPTGQVFIWTFISIFLLIGGIGALVWFYAKEFDLWRADGEPDGGFATSDFMDNATITPSMKATAKFFWIVCVLFLVQVALGILTAHFAVEGQGLYGMPLFDWLPYVVSRTWHTQLGIFWIATAWLATGLYVAPLLTGYEPPFQRFLVNFLFLSLLAIVVGSFVGEWASVHGMFESLTASFWFGHQGYEYIDLGRFWQIYLFIGLLLWTFLMLRALWPMFKVKDKAGSLVFLVVISTVAIGLLFGAGLMWGENTHISMMEYWRWWVVHLWVEGVFEVFATAIVAALLVKMGLVRASIATISVLFATIIFLGAGVLGTFHHLYWSGTPMAVLALGAVFSALEVVPLTVVGFEAYERYKVEGQQKWEATYHWPFMFLGSVLVWNLVGAGMLGFLINPPLALYYLQGLNTTATHGHAALFGVYGMLGLGLMLYCLRGLTNPAVWNTRLLGVAFWCLNIGLAMMVFLSLLPQGLWQGYASFSEYYAYARTAEFMHSPIMETLVWIRVPGDIVFGIGMLAIVLFVFRAFVDSRKTPRKVGAGPAKAAAE